MLLNKEQIIGADDRKYAIVEVPEWGGKVRVSTMSGSMRDNYERMITTQDENGKLKSNTGDLRAKLLAVSIVDESGSQLFDSDDIEALGEKSADAIDRVFKEITRINQLMASDVDDEVKN